MKLRYLFYVLLLDLAFFGIYACSQNGGSQATEETASETETPAEPETQYTLTPFSASPDFPDAKIESFDYKEGKFAFNISGDSYELGVQTSDAPQKMCANSAKGQHIHLIIDNAPYAAKYVAEFDHEVADGEHYLLAFLSRSYHESIKTADAHVTKKITVEDGNLTNSEDVAEPVLHYSRPKGTYVGKANTEKVMLDFYLDNVELGDYKVVADINGEEHTIDTWQPYYIEGLPIGDNKIKLTLVDKDGKTVDAPMNPVERTFVLKEDPVEEQ